MTPLPMTSPISPVYCPRPERWPQFSLRGLFVPAAVIAGSLSLGRAVYEARQQRIAAAAMLELGCVVGHPSADQGSPSALEWFRKLLGEKQYRGVKWVNGSLSQIRNASLEHIRGLIALEYLTLDGTQVTDAGLEHLHGMTQLQRLSLADTKATDAGLMHLEGLTQLQFLHLRGTQVTDAGVQRLQKALPKCKTTSQP